jgi:cell division protein FtsL
MAALSSMMSPSSASPIAVSPISGSPPGAGLRESNGAFLACWTMAVIAATAAFCVHLTVRVRAIELGYEMGRAHSQLTRLREVRRVLELEVASYETPERVDLVARTLLGMAPPGADRVLHAAALPKVLDAEREAVRRTPTASPGATRSGGAGAAASTASRVASVPAASVPAASVPAASAPAAVASSGEGPTRP